VRKPTKWKKTSAFARNKARILAGETFRGKKPSEWRLRPKKRP
jgi:hypothetical protein